MTPEADADREAALLAELEQARAEIVALRARCETDEQTVGELRDSQELTRRLIEAMPGGVVHVRIDGAILTANAEAQRILGLRRDELSARYVNDFEPKTMFEDGSPCTVADYPVTLALVTGQAQPPVTIGVMRPDGALSWAIFTAVPVFDADGATQGAVVTFIDITKRKQLEHELREASKMEAIGRLAGGIAHDFNNLLTVIVGNTADVRAHLPEGSAERDDLDQVLDAARHATSLTGQLLAFARRQPVTPSLILLDVLVDEAAALLRRLIGEHIELEIDHEPDLWPVRVDPGQFQQIIINLALNGRDAMHEGGRLLLSTRNRPSKDGDDCVVLAVRDTGTGIAPVALPHIFEPFFTTKGGSRGTGLGLATCYGIAKQAGGSIEVTSRLGEGTTFEVVIPRASEDRWAALRRPLGVDDLWGTETMLLVEDEPAVLRILERNLRRLGYHVLTACTGAEALQELERSSAIDVLITDVAMPGMSGLELAEKARRMRPQLPIIVMSGYPDNAVDDLRVDPGEFVYLRKPLHANELATNVRALLDGKELVAASPRPS